MAEFRTKLRFRADSNFSVERSRPIFARPILRIFPQPRMRIPSAKDSCRGACIKDIPYQMVKKDGGIIDVLLSATSEKDQDGNITRSFAVITNISERVRAEEASRKLSKRLQMVLEAVDDPVWDWRMDTGEVYFSPNWYSVLGYEPYELPQTYETWAGLLHPEDSGGGPDQTLCI